jgi:hypothetical protein
MSSSKSAASRLSGAIRTPRRSPASEDKLDFKRREMVDWFDPAQLAKTGVKVLLSAILGAYADKREMQAALHPPDEEERLIFDYSARQDIWLDFIADMGDGFDSTYTMAWLLAQKKLRPEGADKEIERGKILILGGDQVYPTAKREEYHDRFTGPYQSALPRIDAQDPPDMFAIPGNHDWYDGLTSFLRLFCQQRKIGEWRTHQNKSYFAIRLPHNWWIWGVDIQFEADIDMPQIEYFERVAREHIKEGHKVILVNAQPSWAEENPEAYRNLDFFVRQTILSYNGIAPVMLTGDLHHYCRYEAEETGRQYITAGGGGAYLFATHRMPDTIALAEGTDKLTCKRKGEFPYLKDSRRLRSGVLLFPFKSWKFGALLAFLYTLFGWLLQSAPKTDGKSFMDHIGQFSILSAEGVSQTLYYFLNAIKHSPSSVLFLVVLALGLKAFSDARSPSGKWIVGILHAAAHLSLNLLLIWAFAYINLKDGFISNTLGITDAEQLRHAAVFTLEMLVIGGSLGGLLMGLYLYISEVIFGRHTNEVFSAQRIPDYKNFLRLRIDESGALTIYPIGVTRVCRKWKYRPDAVDGSPWFEPKSKIESRLIEKPIRINSGN